MKTADFFTNAYFHDDDESKWFYLNTLEDLYGNWWLPRNIDKEAALRKLMKIHTARVIMNDIFRKAIQNF